MAYERCKIILLPTNDKIGSIKLHRETNKMYGPLMAISNQLAYIFHIYICIKKYINTGDLVYSYKENKLIKYDKNDTHDVRYKVIATTDNSLNLPGLSDDFIYKFVRLNGNIDEAFIEYKTLRKYYTINDDTSDYIFDDNKLVDIIAKDKEYNLFIPKINTDNTINIYQVKDTFTLKEVERLLMDYSITLGKTLSIEDCKNWLINNM